VPVSCPALGLLDPTSMYAVQYALINTYAAGF